MNKQSMKLESQVGTHTSPSIHKFLYTPSVRAGQQQQQKASLRDHRANDVATDVERRHIVSNLNHHQEMDFRFVDSDGRCFSSSVFSGWPTMGQSRHSSRTDCSSRKKQSSLLIMYGSHHFSQHNYQLCILIREPTHQCLHTRSQMDKAKGVVVQLER